MRRGVVAGILGGVLTILTVPVGAESLETSFITRDELRMESKQNDALRIYLDRNGYPDVAEIQERQDSGDWDNETVVLYYLDAHKEIAFGRLFMFTGQVGAQRLDRNLTDEEVAALASQPSMRTAADDRLASLAPVGDASGNPADRAEAAAFRAEQAASKVEEAAGRTERAAARAEAVVEKMIAVSRR